MLIRTRRLLLRPAYPDDAAELHAALADEGIVRMLARAPWPYLPEHAQEWCSQPHDPLALSFVIALPDASGAPIVGGVGIDCAPAVAELGYWIAAGWRRQGFASEAATAVLDAAAVLGHRRIAAGHWLDNPASGSVLARLGFAETGEVRSAACLGRGGEILSSRRYACELPEQFWLRRAA